MLHTLETPSDENSLVETPSDEQDRCIVLAESVLDHKATVLTASRLGSCLISFFTHSFPIKNLIILFFFWLHFLLEFFSSRNPQYSDVLLGVVSILDTSILILSRV